MIGPIAEAPPRLRARIAGVLYLITIAGGSFGLFVRSGVIVRGDAAATMANILASEPLYRSGIVAELIGTLAYIGVTAMLYGLLKPVSRTISLLAAFFSLAGCAIGAAVSVYLLAPLVLLNGAPYLAPFRPDQLQALAYAALRMHGQGYNIGMICFGVYCALLGYLVFRSAFFPRFLGVLLAIAGLAWLTDSFAELLSPRFSSHLSRYPMMLGFLGEAALAGWLLVVGVNVAQWEKQAGGAEALASTA